MKHLKTRLEQLEEKFLPKNIEKPRKNEIEELIEKAKEDKLTYDERLRLAMFFDVMYYLGVLLPPNECWEQIKNGGSLKSLIIEDKWNTWIEQLREWVSLKFLVSSYFSQRELQLQESVKIKILPYNLDLSDNKYVPFTDNRNCFHNQIFRNILKDLVMKRYVRLSPNLVTLSERLNSDYYI